MTRKMPKDRRGLPTAAVCACKPARNAAGCIIPDPRLDEANKRAFSPIKFQPVEAGLPLDLFGQPVEPRSSVGGRPRHLPTAASRALVADLRGEGATLAVIARALRLSVPTLQLNYPIELGSGSKAWRRRAARNAKSNGRKS